MSVADIRPFAAKSSIIVRLVGSAKASNNCWPGTLLPSPCRDKLLSGSLSKLPPNQSYEHPSSIRIRPRPSSPILFFRGQGLGPCETCLSGLDVAERLPERRVCEEL